MCTWGGNNVDFHGVDVELIFYALSRVDGLGNKTREGAFIFHGQEGRNLTIETLCRCKVGGGT